MTCARCLLFKSVKSVKTPWLIHKMAIHLTTSAQILLRGRPNKVCHSFKSTGQDHTKACLIKENAQKKGECFHGKPSSPRGNWKRFSWVCSVWDTTVFHRFLGLLITQKLLMQVRMQQTDYLTCAMAFFSACGCCNFFGLLVLAPFLGCCCFFFFCWFSSLSLLLGAFPVKAANQFLNSL